MQQHIKNYFRHFNYDESSFIKCEITECYAQANQIHHIIPRSKFGSKRKDEMDAVENLVALCFKHHNEVHNLNVSLNEIIKEIVKTRKP